MSPVSNSPQALRLISRIFPLIGICSILLSSWFAIQTQSFLKRSVATTGTVVELTAVHGTDINSTQYTYAPVFQFTDAAGRSYTIASNSSSNPPEFQVGEVVPVRYDPQKPADAKIDTFVQLWLFPVIFAGVGSIFGVIGVVLFWKSKRSA